MSRLCIATRGAGSWRERLANPDGQWKRGCSAFETAASWESSSNSPTGLPEPIAQLFQGTEFAEPVLHLAIAEHKVPLPGGRAESQCDVWALLGTKAGMLSLSVEAKAQEPFGQGNEPLAHWLAGDGSKRSRENRQERWDHVKRHLPEPVASEYSDVAYQLLHRCAAAVIEARRFGLQNAAFVVQAFGSPPESFEEFARLCQEVGVKAQRGQMNMTAVGDVRLGIGWADCPFATDADIASVA